MLHPIKQGLKPRQRRARRVLYKNCQRTGKYRLEPHFVKENFFHSLIDFNYV